MRMQCCPLRSLDNASSLFPGGTRSSSIVKTESSWSSFLNAIFQMFFGQIFLAAHVDFSLKISFVALRKDALQTEHKEDHSRGKVLEGEAHRIKRATRLRQVESKDVSETWNNKNRSMCRLRLIRTLLAEILLLQQLCLSRVPPGKFRYP